MTEEADRPDVGTVAEETAKLLGALSGWAKEHGPDLGAGVGDLASGAAAALQDANAHFATGGEDCKYCPVCRVVHMVREFNPEARTHLALAAANLAQAAATVLASGVTDEQREARKEPVEKIDLDEDWSEGPFEGPFG